MKLKAHPMADQYPTMNDIDYASLVADIRNNGLKFPIVLYEGAILDGRHRARACAELNIAPAAVEFKGTKQEAAAFAFSANRERRHLTRDQQKLIVMAELSRDPTQSDRAIARKAKVHNDTVAKARAKAEAGDQIDHHEKRVGLDGKTQPSGKKPASERIAEITDLLAAGHNVQQVADRLHITEDRVRSLIHGHKIEITQWATHRGRSNPKLSRVIEETVNALIGAAHGLQIVKDAKPDLEPSHAAELLREANEAMKSIRWMLNTLKEIAK